MSPAPLETGDATSFLIENSTISPKTAKSQSLGITSHWKTRAAVAGPTPAGPVGLTLFARSSRHSEQTQGSPGALGKVLTDPHSGK